MFLAGSTETGKKLFQKGKEMEWMLWNCGKFYFA